MTYVIVTEADLYHIKRISVQCTNVKCNNKHPLTLWLINVISSCEQNWNFSRLKYFMVNVRDCQWNVIEMTQYLSFSSISCNKYFYHILRLYFWYLYLLHIYFSITLLVKRNMKYVSLFDMEVHRYRWVIAYNKRVNWKVIYMKHLYYNFYVY